MGHFVSKISNFEVDLSEDVTGLVPLQIFKGIKKGSAPGTGFARSTGSLMLLYYQYHTHLPSAYMQSICYYY